MSDISSEEAEQLDLFRVVISAMREDWPWFSAVWAFDYDDPAPLADLIRERPIPDELKSLVADIVSGKRKPNKKAAAKAKIPANQRANIFYRYWVDRLLTEASKKLSVRLLEADTIRYKLTPIEPIEIVRDIESDGRKMLEELQELYGAGPDTLKALRSEGKTRMKEWPTG